jgi:hypothetical protein
MNYLRRVVLLGPHVIVDSISARVTLKSIQNDPASAGVWHRTRGSRLHGPDPERHRPGRRHLLPAPARPACHRLQRAGSLGAASEGEVVATDPLAGGEAFAATGLAPRCTTASLSRISIPSPPRSPEEPHRRHGIPGEGAGHRRRGAGLPAIPSRGNPAKHRATTSK